MSDIKEMCQSFELLAEVCKIAKDYVEADCDQLGKDKKTFCKINDQLRKVESQLEKSTDPDLKQCYKDFQMCESILGQCCHKKSSLSPVAIAAIIIGSVLGLIVVGVIIYYITRHK